MNTMQQSYNGFAYLFDILKKSKQLDSSIALI